MPRTIDFQAVAKVLEQSARDGKSVAPMLKRRCRAIARQIEADAKVSEISRLWGQSINFDEIASKQIVDPQIMLAICEMAGTSCSDEIVHAGLQHTYGYLFSTISTPYGYKRDRWVKPDVEAGFQIKSPSIRPVPEQGTLLANLTYFLGRIAFRGQSRELALLRRLRSAVSSEVLSVPYRQLKVRRLVETVKLSARRTLFIQTDIVSYLTGMTSSPSDLLVYSLRLSNDPIGKLVTAFPVSEEIVRELTSEDSQGSKVAVRLRFNAHVDGLSRQPMIGQRSLQK